MSIYDKASLVLIPSGTKTSKVYSQKPTNGDGDFTFSRSTAATRVNASGNIEKETSNLLLQSNAFTTTWTTSNAPNITSGQSGYDGTSDAWKIELTAAYGQIIQSISISGLNCTSIYAKAGTIDFIRLRIDGSPNSIVDFNLTDGSTAYSYGNVYATSTSVGGGWYRLSMVSNVSSSTLRIYPLVAANDLSGTSGYIYIQDAQLEQGLVARDYIETTTAAVEGGITDNVPRLDYTDSSCPALLLEPQRTNSLPHSENFNAWVKQSGVSIDVNTTDTLSPEGKYNSCKITSTSGTTGLYAIRSGGFETNTATRSVYLKGENGGETLVLKDGSGFGGTKNITLTTEWVRYELKTTADGNNYQGFFIDDVPTDSAVYAYGAQMETGSYATSYIPTYGSAVTRNAEACNSAGTSATFNDSEGVLFVELEALAEDSTYRFISVSDGTSTNRINILLNNNNTLRAFVAGVGSLISSVDITQNNKAAIKYKSGDYAFWVNGTEVATNTSTSGTHTGLNELAFDMGDGSNDFYGKTKQVLYIPTALTDAELEDLTTL